MTLTEPLALLLLLAVALTLDSSRPLLAGLGTAALLLTRPNAYFVGIIVAIVIWRSLGIRRMLSCLAIMGVVVTPWLVRNEIQVGTFRLTTSDGFTVAAVYGPPAQEQGHFIDPVYDDWYDTYEQRLSQFDEASWNRNLMKIGIDALKQHPSFLFHVVFRSIRGFFEIQPELNIFPERQDGRNLDFRKATLPLFYVLLVGGTIGIFRERRNRRLWPLLALAAQFSVISLLTVPPPRLRAPLDLVLCIGLGIAIAAIRGRRAKPLALTSISKFA